MEYRTRGWIVWLLVLVLGLGLLFASCGDDDDDDDSGSGDDDDSGDDDADDDSTDDPPVVDDTTEMEYALDTDAPYTIQSDASDDVGLDAVDLYYRVDGGDFESVSMTEASAGTYGGEIPGQSTGAMVEFYVEATDTAEQTAADPPDAPTSLFSFYVLAESELGYDDGTSEGTYAAGGEGSYVFLRVTPPDYPAYLRSISYYCEDNIDGEAKPFVLYDAAGAGDPPAIEGVINLGDVFTPVEEAWTEIDVSDVDELATPLESGDFYIGFLNVTSTPNWGWDEGFDDDYYVHTWSVGDSNWHHHTTSDGVVLFRADVATP